MEYTVYIINGMHCVSCATLIKMELDEAGFESVEIDAAAHTVRVPATLVDSVAKISDVIESAGDYSISLPS